VPASWITVTEHTWRAGAGLEAAGAQIVPAAPYPTGDPATPDRLGGASEWSFARREA
jgi:hypothetical protein